METPELFFRGQEDRKQARELSRERRRKDKERDLDRGEHVSRQSARIRFSDEAFSHAAEPREFFQDRVDQVLDRFFQEIQNKDFDPIRSKFFSREKLEDSLRELSRDFRVLSFLGAGFNRAVFLVEDNEGKRLAAKVPIRSRGLRDNRTEATIYEMAAEGDDRFLFARTVLGRDGIALQEVCRPLKIEKLFDGEISLLVEIEMEYGISDLQVGESLEDERRKIFDFGLTIPVEEDID